MSLRDNTAELIGKTSFNPPALCTFPQGLKPLGKEQSQVCAFCKASGNSSSLPWHSERTEAGKAGPLLLLSRWASSSLLELSRSEGTFQRREEGAGVSAGSLSEQALGEAAAGQDEARLCLQTKRPSPPQLPSPPAPLPTHSGCHLHITHWASLRLLFQVLLPSSQPTLSLLHLLMAGNILQPLPSCTAVCCWCQPSETAPAHRWHCEGGSGVAFVNSRRFSSLPR